MIDSFRLSNRNLNGMGRALRVQFECTVKMGIDETGASSKSMSSAANKLLAYLAFHSGYSL